MSDEEDAAQLRGFYLEIENDNLFGSIGLHPRLHELTRVDDD
jgi:hypothetical protein